MKVKTLILTCLCTVMLGIVALAGTYIDGKEVGINEEQVDANTEVINGILGIFSVTNASTTLVATNMQGQTYVNAADNAANFELPTAVAGHTAVIRNARFAQVLTIDPASGDAMILPNGVINTIGNAVDSPPSNNCVVVVTAIDDTYWVMDTNQDWTDGGED